MLQDHKSNKKTNHIKRVSYFLSRTKEFIFMNKIFLFMKKIIFYMNIIKDGQDADKKIKKLFFILFLRIWQ